MFGLNKKTECEKVSEQLSAYIDGQLEGNELARVELHLHGCEACQQELAGLRATVDILGSAPDVPAPRSFAIDPATADASDHSQQYGSRALRWLKPAMAAASVVFVFALLLAVFQSVGDVATRGGSQPASDGLEDGANVLGAGSGVEWWIIALSAAGAIVLAIAIAFIYVSWRRHRGYYDRDEPNDLLR